MLKQINGCNYLPHDSLPPKLIEKRRLSSSKDSKDKCSSWKTNQINNDSTNYSYNYTPWPTSSSQNNSQLPKNSSHIYSPWLTSSNSIKDSQWPTNNSQNYAPLPANSSNIYPPFLINNISVNSASNENKMNQLNHCNKITLYNHTSCQCEKITNDDKKYLHTEVFEIEPKTEPDITNTNNDIKEQERKHQNSENNMKYLHTEVFEIEPKLEPDATNTNNDFKEQERMHPDSNANKMYLYTEVFEIEPKPKPAVKSTNNDSKEQNRGIAEKHSASKKQKRRKKKLIISNEEKHYHQPPIMSYPFYYASQLEFTLNQSGYQPIAEQQMYHMMQAFNESQIQYMNLLVEQHEFFDNMNNDRQTRHRQAKKNKKK
ncbi:hypothetical protein M9Y10_015772 [Tritrichomonas musculus]|uniref:Uncharacterized protein n=1 Tax=Tritrichomonas musculus TaxID=1915356 RepID=A0ABR2I5J8_9EUKA